MAPMPMGMDGTPPMGMDGGDPMSMGPMAMGGCDPNPMCKSDRGDRGGEQEYRLDGVGRVRIRDNGEIKADLFDEAIEVEVGDGKIEIETNRDLGNIKIDLNERKNKARARMEGMEIRLDGDKNRIEIMLGASKIAATASVLAGIALY